MDLLPTTKTIELKISDYKACILEMVPWDLVTQRGIFFVHFLDLCNHMHLSTTRHFSK